MFGTSFGSEISWLIPAALIGLVAGLWFTRRFPRTDKIRAALLLWGGSLIVTALVFSFMAGTIHPYYAIALAPPIAAVVAISGRELWRGRSNTVVRGVLAAMIAVTGVWSFILLGRDASWLPWLRWIVLIGSVAGAVLLALSTQKLRRFAVIGLLVGSLTALSGTTAYTLATAATPHSGSIPTSGPTRLGHRRARRRVRPGRPDRRRHRPRRHSPRRHDPRRRRSPAATVPGGAGGAAPGAGGGAATTNSELVALLEATTTRWAAATVGAQSAAGYILGTDKAIMGIGGFTGSDPAPTLAQFQQYVADGDISYFISGGGMGGGAGGPGGGSGSGSEITAWVQANFTATTVGGATVYDLTSAQTS